MGRSASIGCGLHDLSALRQTAEKRLEDALLLNTVYFISTFLRLCTDQNGVGAFVIQHEHGPAVWEGSAKADLEIRRDRNHDSARFAEERGIAQQDMRKQANITAS